MMAVDEKRIASIVEAVLKNIEEEGSSGSLDMKQVNRGIFSELEMAIDAAVEAQKRLLTLSEKKRKGLIEAVREASVNNAERLGKLAVEITGLGRPEDKKAKIINSATLTPGMEDLRAEIIQGDDGITLIEKAAIGFIVLIAPTTHPIAQIVNHVICMLAAGNSTFICPHPRAQEASRDVIRVLNEAIVKNGGPENLITALDRVDLNDVKTVCRHQKTQMIVAAGGPSVVEMALTSGKKAIAAGPGNPPVLVDETADIARAARDIVNGASFDNNILCIAEKEIFVVNQLADRLIAELEKNNSYILQGNEINRLTELIVKDPEHVNPNYVGKDASLILGDAGIKVSSDIRMAVMEVDFEHPLVKIEQMLPVLPLVRVKSFEEGLQKSVMAERNCGHTAMIHSSNIDRIARFSREMNVTIAVANGPSYAGLDVEGDSDYTHTIAEPTFEGICTPKDFTRNNRCSICGGLKFA
ncbi:MAG TPA: aldehyde dehydrogenase [Halanaerobiales bacterium]|nr:aldehyde dehydrogenase [Halanaerobiales bacterium]